MFTPDNITEMAGNNIFVFGSNHEGVHGKGAAHQAKSFGAKHGEGYGRFGNTYAIATRRIDLVLYKQNIGSNRRFSDSLVKMPIEEIRSQVDRLFEYARTNTHLHFWVTKVGCGYAGYNVEDMAVLFIDFPGLSNVSLPKEFYDIIKKKSNHFLE